jgi:hypothetical protein
MTLHPSTFKYHQPTDDQKVAMDSARQAAFEYAEAIEELVPDGPDKTFVLRELRTLSMWVNVAITRQADGSPRA